MGTGRGHWQLRVRGLDPSYPLGGRYDYYDCDEGLRKSPTRMEAGC